MGNIFLENFQQPPQRVGGAIARIWFSPDCPAFLLPLTDTFLVGVVATDVSLTS